MADQDDEIVDQNDIDKLLEASSFDTEESAEDVDDIGELSQDDIDALMDGGGGGASTPAISEEYEEEEDDLDLISQDDINRLVNKKNEEPREEPNEEQVDTPETIETILEEEPIYEEEPEIQEAPEVQEEIEEPIAQEEPVALEDGVIDESEAVSVEECLVTQENIDLLIKEDQENSVAEDDFQLEEQELEQESITAEDPLIAEDSMSEEDIALDQELVQEEITTEQEVVAMEEEKEEEDVLEDSESDASVIDLGEDDDLKEELDSIGDDELQDDIDSLLDDPEDTADEDEDWEADSLISQADIEDLIKSSENEDEDALGDLGPSEDSFGEEGYEEEDEAEDEEYEEEDSTVVLEEPEELPDEKSQAKPEKKKKGKKKKRSIKIGKKVIVIAASVMFLAVALSLAGFFFLGKDKKSIPAQRKMVSEVMPIEESVVESVDVIVEESAEPTVSRPIPSNNISEPLVMDNFVILAPETIEGLAYIEADITIDYSTDNAYYEIKKNMPFYRDVIYLAIQKALASNKGDKITESDLLVIVRTALQKVMPEGSIKKVDFKAFKAG